MLTGMLGTKLGMTQYIHEDGAVSGVTAVEVGPCIVTQIKNAATDGYDAIQIGFQQVPDRKLQKARRGHLEKHGLDSLRHLREVRALADSDPSVGDVVKVDQVFTVGEDVDFIGQSKGKGFAGGVKRWHFRGGPKTHGQGDRWRAPGSIGAGTTPGRVVKGHKMAGQMGNKRVTQKRGRIVAVDSERNLLFVRGSVPGSMRSLVMISKRIGLSA
jgi:large subunit ribosomal protein L3